jgi:dTDP-4-dehydrorhamnose 3,5-epimerase
MEFVTTNLPGVILVKPRVFADERGFFLETWRRDEFVAAGIVADFVQDNHSCSSKGTLRGLHYQVQRPQGKLVRVTRGEVFDVTVDIRQDSPTFGRWIGQRLSAGNKHMLWVPPGLAHGFYVLSDVAEFQYKCTDYYAPALERAIRWDDPDLGIEWPLLEGVNLVLSEKDREAGSLRALVDAR